MKISNSRLFSLDVFRGMTIALMITVNIPGSWEYIYTPLKHAEWHGCTPTDLVFPFFLFIVGASIAFSFSKFNYKLSFGSVYKIIERTFLIFTVGFMLNNYPFFTNELSSATLTGSIIQIIYRICITMIPFLGFIWLIKQLFSKAGKFIPENKSNIAKIIYLFILLVLAGLLLYLLLSALYRIEFFNKDFSSIRIMGVLQRIALAYGFGAIIILLVRQKYIPFVAAIILFLYWFLSWYFGGNDPYSLESNIGRQIDIILLGESHLWTGKGIPFDPEGLFSTISSIGTVLIGFLTGKYILDNMNSKNPWLLKLVLSGILLVLAGQLWGLVFPINKPLWTSSYVLYTSGLAILVLTLMFWLIDMLNYKKLFTFFNVFGVNPLFAFSLHVIWVKIIGSIIKWEVAEGETTNAYAWIYSNVFQAIGGNYLGSLLFAVTHIGFFYFILLILYRKKIFIKI